MGPAATADLYEKIIFATPASKDQEHIPVVMWADPRIPDRLEALAGKGPSPVPHMVEGLEQLEAAGASFVVMPCNTAHLFLPELRQQVSIPIIEMMDETSKALASRSPAVRRAGLLGTTATVKGRLYHAAFERNGIETVVPDAKLQDELMTAIRQIKAGNVSAEVADIVRRAADNVREAGADVAVLACTELPLVLRDGQASLPLIDATQVLAQAAVALATQGTHASEPVASAGKFPRDQ